MSPHTATPARHGAGFVRFVIGVLVIATVVVLGWGVFASWNRDANGDGNPDGFTLRVLDRQWWDASKQDARPLVARARDWALESKEQIWGDGGYLDQGEDWLADWQAQREQREDAPQAHSQAENSELSGKPMAKQQSSGATAEIPAATAAPAAEAPAAPAAPSRSPATLRLEERIQAAEEHFAQGLEAYRSADPSQGWTDERAAHYDQAREHFLQVRRILVEEAVVDTYAGMDDHDPLIAKKAGELAQLNQKLLYDATKSSGGI
jgi:hypothetical protein